jgi:hypothetical protein
MSSRTRSVITRRRFVQLIGVTIGVAGGVLVLPYLAAAVGGRARTIGRGHSSHARAAATSMLLNPAPPIPPAGQFRRRQP